MRKLLVVLAVVSLLGVGTATAQEKSDRKPVRFDVPVVPEAVRHLDLLEVPGYAALALENNGLNPSLSSRLVVKERESFQIRAGVVRYIGKRGAVYTYETGVSLALGVGETSLTVPVEVDTSGVSGGRLVIKVYPPLAAVLPQELLERVEFKIRALADLQSQRKMLAYLDRIAKEQEASGRGLEGMLDAIALEAYNRASAATPSAVLRDRGQAESLSDQAMLLATLAIWLIGFPVFLVFVRSRRKGQRQA